MQLSHTQGGSEGLASSEQTCPEEGTSGPTRALQQEGEGLLFYCTPSFHTGGTLTPCSPQAHPSYEQLRHPGYC